MQSTIKESYPMSVIVGVLEKSKNIEAGKFEIGGEKIRCSLTLLSQELQCARAI